MIVGLGVLELHLPYARDLKSKRRVVKSLVDRLHARFRISAADRPLRETGCRRSRRFRSDSRFDPA